MLGPPNWGVYSQQDHSKSLSNKVELFCDAPLLGNPVVVNRPKGGSTRARAVRPIVRIGPGPRTYIKHIKKSRKNSLYPYIHTKLEKNLTAALPAPPGSHKPVTRAHNSPLSSRAALTTYPESTAPPEGGASHTFPLCLSAQYHTHTNPSRISHIYNKRNKYPVC